MKRLILAATAALSLGMATANAMAAAPNSANQQSGDQFNFTRGGGG